jgi:GAF domain-containing protein
MAGRAPVLDVHQILINHQLAIRGARRPRRADENRAMTELIAAMAANSEAVLSTVTKLALRLCNAGSTGISLLEEPPDGEAVFRWAALAGAFESFVGGHTPKNWSPCGLCLQHGGPVLPSYPGRVFTYFEAAQLAIVEGLVVPISYAGEDLGTLWIVSHTEQRKFDREDVRIMSNLANATAVALHMQRSRNS